MERFCFVDKNTIYITDLENNDVISSHDLKREVKMITPSADGTKIAIIFEKGMNIFIYDLGLNKVVRVIRQDTNASNPYTCNDNRKTSNVYFCNDNRKIGVFDGGHLVEMYDLEDYDNKYYLNMKNEVLAGVMSHNFLYTVFEGHNTVTFRTFKYDWSCWCTMISNRVLPDTTCDQVVFSPCDKYFLYRVNCEIKVFQTDEKPVLISTILFGSSPEHLQIIDKTIYGIFFTRFFSREVRKFEEGSWVLIESSVFGPSECGDGFLLSKELGLCYSNTLQIYLLGEGLRSLSFLDFIDKALPISKMCFVSPITITGRYTKPALR